MRVQNYGDDGNERRRRLRGYHPPACTCFRCNEARVAKEAAEEEERRAAEYDKRIAEEKAGAEAKEKADARAREATEAQERARAKTEARARERQEARERALADEKSRAEARERGDERARARAREARSQPLKQPVPPRTGAVPQPSASQPSRTESRLSNSPSVSPAASHSHGRRRPGLAILLWAIFLAGVVGLVGTILYLSNPGLLGSSQDGEQPIAVAAPTEEPTQEPTREPTSSPPAVPTATAAPAPTATPALAPTMAPTPTPTAPPIPTPTPHPPPAKSPDGWALDCPGCRVVVLNSRATLATGLDALQQGDHLRLVACTDTQTTELNQYLLKSPGGLHAGVAVFGTVEYPSVADGLDCFEMLGEFNGTSEYSMAPWKHIVGGESRSAPILAKTDEAHTLAGPEWKEIGELPEFRIVDWAARDGLDGAGSDQGPAALATPEPTVTNRVNPTPEPSPTALSRSTPVPSPSPAQTRARTPTPAPRRPSVVSPTAGLPPSSDELARVKVLMLDLINEERVNAGVGPVVMGSNGAAQMHAENAIEGCFTGHWGLDGTKPYMRYFLAGGYQYNGENVSGHHVCIEPGQMYAPLGNIDRAVKRTMSGFMGSPGHRDNILYPTHRMVNLGIAWDRYNIRVVQHFEGDYLEFDRLPAFDDGQLAFSGTLRHGAVLRTDSRKTDLGVQIFYDPPLQALTRGQLVRAYSYGHGDLVAAVRPPVGDGYEYLTNSFSQCWEVSRNPYDVSPDADAPRTPEESTLMHGLAQTLPVWSDCGTVPWLDASRWILRQDSFDVQVEMDSVLDDHGPGIYSVVLWADVGGETDAVGDYLIFHETEPPKGYNP